jgi:hypothetical protein
MAFGASFFPEWLIFETESKVFPFPSSFPSLTETENGPIAVIRLIPSFPHNHPLDGVVVVVWSCSTYCLSEHYNVPVPVTSFKLLRLTIPPLRINSLSNKRDIRVWFVPSRYQLNIDIGRRAQGTAARGWEVFPVYL